jgi:hypothetical protein
VEESLIDPPVMPNAAPSPSGRPVFITARFRSGSTLLWNMYEQSAGWRAYYEPCHDNLLAHIRSTAPMPSHRGVKAYWESYRPLLADLPDVHRHEFGVTRLLLEADDAWRALERYLRFLVDRSAPRRAALQFNRIDFRLPWLRQRFPDARIVHLWRGARESYASSVRHLLPGDFDRHDQPNVYDIFEWCVSLAPALPFLADPAIDSFYARHYLLWKLSRLMGERQAHVSLSFERDLAAPDGDGLRRLVEAGCFDAADVPAARALVEPVETGSWSLLHQHVDFERTEAASEELLDDLGLNDWFGLEPLAAIRARRAAAWTRVDSLDRSSIVDRMMVAYSRQRSEVTRLLHEVRSRDVAGARPEPVATIRP